jgi:hypothetical protein
MVTAAGSIKRSWDGFLKERLLSDYTEQESAISLYWSIGQVKLSRGILWLLAIALVAPHLFATTWYIRPDGGSRYSSNVSGQCDGKTDAAYRGGGKNQHCAFNDFRYMWDDKSGQVGVGKWIIAGGDTVIVRGCTAGASQSNPDNPHCRLGWDAPTGNPPNTWCYAVGSYGCYNPPIPAGTAAQHTRILGQNYASCNTGGATNPKLYVSNLTQLFGGFSQQYTFNLESTQYVDIQCIELTNHNAQCTHGGSPAYPRGCHTDQPLDDYADNGFLTNKSSSNITLQDVYVHGFTGSGLKGPIGGPITMTRVNASFNAHAGWDFDDGRNTPDAAGSAIIAKYVTMTGNGCYEEYPVTHAFPARACYDDSSGGFGDAWSGQDTDLDTFICDHCEMAYNTKDAFIGPHTNVHTLTITNSQSYGNMGAQWKWNNTPDSTTTFTNNLTVGSCARFREVIPGAPHSYDLASKVGGAYLSDYCRAGGNTVAINSQQNSHVLFAHNTFVDYADTVFLLSCGPANGNHSEKCGNTQFVFTNNIFLGYTLKGGEAPGLFYVDDRSIKVTSNHNIEYGNRSGFGDSCRGDIICSDPRLENEPPQQGWTNQTFLDNFTFYPRSDSPANGHGVPMNGIANDFYGSARPNPPSIGAVEPRRAQQGGPGK